MEPANKFHEVWELFLKPETSDWRIIKEDGGEEDFDPSTMIDSFIESEVPLPHAFAIFDLFLKRAAERFPDKRLTHAEIHAWVSEAFLSYPHKDRTIWFASYENVFSPDLAKAPTEEGFVYARKMGEMRKLIIDLLEKEFDIVVSPGPETPGFRAISSEQLDVAVRRIIKLIRQCGFYKLSVAFLRDFCRELAKHSCKLYLPAASIDSAALKKRLNDAEEQIALSRIQYQNHPTAGQSMLLIASQVMTLTWLQWNRFVAKISPLESLAQMKEVLRDGRQLSGTNQPVAAIYDGLQETFQSRGLKPERLLRAVEDVSELLMLDRLSPSEFLRAVENSERLLNLIRIATKADDNLSDVIASFHTDPGSRITRLHAIAAYLQNLRINTRMLSIADDTPVPVLHIEIGKVYTSLLERGRAVHLMLDVDNVAIPFADLGAFMSHMQKEQDSVGLYISSSLISSNLPDNVFVFLKDMAANGRIIVPTGSTQLLRILSEREKMFDLISDLAAKTFKAASRQNPPLSAPVSIDPAIKGYDREVLEQASHQLRKGSPLDCATRLGQLLEDVLRLNGQLVLSYGESEAKWKTALGDNKLFDHIGFEKKGPKESIDLLREARRLARNFPALQRLLPTDSDLNFANTARELRNTVTHIAEQESLVPELLKKVIALVKSIGPSAKWDLVATVAGFDESLIIVFWDGTYRNLSAFNLPPNYTAPVVDSIYFLIRAGTDLFIPLVRTCKCTRDVRWKFDIASVNMTCSFCRASMPKDARVNHLRKLALTVEKEAGRFISQGQEQNLVLGAPSSSTPGIKANEAVRIFISYAHADRKYMDENALLTYLKAVEGDNVSLWYDRQIRASDLWDDKIKSEISDADIAVVLVSQAFLNSDYCRNVEIARFLKLRREAGLRIFPIVLSACEWQREDWLKSTQSVPGGGKNIELHFRETGKRKYLYNQILEDLRAIIEQVRFEKRSRS
jgi:hypothetical protein